MDAEKDTRPDAADPHTADPEAPFPNAQEETPEERLERIADEHRVNIDGDLDEAKNAGGSAAEGRRDPADDDVKTDDDEDPEPPD